MWACNVMGAVLGLRRGTKARTVELELNMEEKEAGNCRVSGRQKRSQSSFRGSRVRGGMVPGENRSGHTLEPSTQLPPLL